MPVARFVDRAFIHLRRLSFPQALRKLAPRCISPPRQGSQTVKLFHAKDAKKKEGREEFAAEPASGAK
jgi:hypothetical protein